MNIKVAGSILAFLSCFIMRASADTVYLKNGRTLQGLVTREYTDSIELEVGFGTVNFDKEQIERIDKSDPDETFALQSKWKKEKQAYEEKWKKIQEEEKQKPKKVDFSEERGGMSVLTKLNGKVEVNLFFDTGAAYILLTKKVGKELGIDMENKKDIMQLQLADGRKTMAKHVILESVQVQDAQAQNVEAVVLLEDTPSENFKDGLLGMSFLKHFNFKVDQKENKLVLEKIR